MPHASSPPVPTSAWALGLLAVAIFALTLPLTRIAVGPIEAPQMSAGFVSNGRAAFAGLLALAVLAAGGAMRAGRRPSGGQWRGLAATALGVVFGFPYFLGLAVREVEASHAAVVTGLLPMATAVIGALWLRQRMRLGFWLAAVAGLLLVLAFAAWRGGARLQWADLYLLAAVLSAGFGYVCGARLASPMLPPQDVIGWVLVLALPVTLPLALYNWPAQPPSAAAWWSLAYLAVFSQWLGFFAWYRALADGRAVRISQVQLLQPFLAIWFSVPLLGEPLDAATVGFTLAVMATVLLSRQISASGSPAAKAAASPADHPPPPAPAGPSSSKPSESVA